MPVTQYYKTTKSFGDHAIDALTIVAGCLLLSASPILEAFGLIGN